MIDKVSEEVRSYIMSSVKNKDTAPEMIVRKLLHSLGYRYRLHRKDLPGSPDVVFGKRKKAIFVHGCFWHGHDCKYGRKPQSNVDYWGPKIQNNQTRDAEALARLDALGWKTLVIWQCELKDLDSAQTLLIEFLGKRLAD